MAITHFVVTVSLTITAFGVGMARFATAADASLAERVLRVVVEALNLPVVTLALAVIPARALPRLWGYVPFALNSLVWGLGLAAALRRWRAVRRLAARAR